MPSCDYADTGSCACPNRRALRRVILEMGVAQRSREAQRSQLRSGPTNPTRHGQKLGRPTIKIFEKLWTTKRNTSQKGQPKKLAKGAPSDTPPETNSATFAPGPTSNAGRQGKEVKAVETDATAKKSPVKFGDQVTGDHLIKNDDEEDYDVLLDTVVVVLLDRATKWTAVYTKASRSAEHTHNRSDAALCWITGPHIQLLLRRHTRAECFSSGVQVETCYCHRGDATD